MSDPIRILVKRDELTLEGEIFFINLIFKGTSSNVLCIRSDLERPVTS